MREFLVHVLNGSEVHGSILPNRRMMTAAGLDAQNALRRQRLRACENELVFLRINVVSKDRVGRLGSWWIRVVSLLLLFLSSGQGDAGPGITSLSIFKVVEQARQIARESCLLRAVLTPGVQPARLLTRR
jgi:hypothetical protein